MDASKIEGVQVGDIVRAKTRQAERLFGKEQVHAEPGDLGIVIDHRPGYLPTVEFMSTHEVWDCDPEELEVVARGQLVTSKPAPEVLQ